MLAKTLKDTAYRWLSEPRWYLWEGGFLLIARADGVVPAHAHHAIQIVVALDGMVAICGGFTTFSSFSLQTLDLMRSGAMLRAGANIVASVVLCVTAVAFGHFLAAQFNMHAAQVAQIPIEEEAEVADV